MSTISEGSSRTLSALFETEGDARRAVDRLIDAGIAKDRIRMMPGYESDDADVDRTVHHRGFFGALADFFFPEEDRYAYAEGLTRGGYLVVVDNLPAAQHDTALDILDDEGSIDLDQREASWRAEGWTGYAGAPEGYGAVAPASKAGAAGSVAGTPRQGDEVIPVVNEELRVGKRDVDLGRVRVRSYVREEPVSADVDLHEERVAVERRAVDRPLTDADNAFQDRVIEADEHAEEAVVSKQARVTEEVSLRKEGSDHTQTIRDTVRKTDVEVEDNRKPGQSQRQA